MIPVLSSAPKHAEDDHEGGAQNRQGGHNTPPARCRPPRRARKFRDGLIGALLPVRATVRMVPQLPNMVRGHPSVQFAAVRKDLIPARRRHTVHREPHRLFPSLRGSFGGVQGRRNLLPAAQAVVVLGTALVRHDCFPEGIGILLPPPPRMSTNLPPGMVAAGRQQHLGQLTAGCRHLTPLCRHLTPSCRRLSVVNADTEDYVAHATTLLVNTHPRRS